MGSSPLDKWVPAPHPGPLQRDVFGTAGDFITSPEISQMFGEVRFSERVEGGKGGGSCWLPAGGRWWVGVEGRSVRLLLGRSGPVRHPSLAAACLLGE